MRTCLLFVTLCCALSAASGTNLLPNSELRAAADGSVGGWATWSPRPELAPKFAVEHRDGTPCLTLAARRFEDFGGWVALVSAIQPGKFYRAEVSFVARDIEAEATSVIARVSWYRNADGTGELQRDYLDRFEADGAGRKCFRTLQAPVGAQAAKLELCLRWTARGSVAWCAPAFSEVPPPARRIVRVATTKITVGPKPTVAANSKLMADLLDQIGPQKPDVVLFSENLVDRATRLPLAEKAQTIPGPLTELLGEGAKRHRTYVITTLHERDGDFFYNTAVLIDRDGRIAGKYRKVHLAMEEADAGITPGSEYPVFDTEFGRIGILTCWDSWFSEPARIMRLRGAEILFLPLAGDGDERHWDIASHARAMDNGLFFVSSGTVSDSSRILAPNGDVLGEARGNFAYVLKELDLNQEWRLRYLSVASGTGEAKSLYVRERRPETYAPLVDATNGNATQAAPSPRR